MTQAAPPGVGICQPRSGRIVCTANDLEVDIASAWPAAFGERPPGRNRARQPPPALTHIAARARARSAPLAPPLPSPSSRSVLTVLHQFDNCRNMEKVDAVAALA